MTQLVNTFSGTHDVPDFLIDRKMSFSYVYRPDHSLRIQEEECTETRNFEMLLVISFLSFCLLGISFIFSKDGKIVKQS